MLRGWRLRRSYSRRRLCAFKKTRVSSPVSSSSMKLLGAPLRRGGEGRCEPPVTASVTVWDAGGSAFYA